MSAAAEVISDVVDPIAEVVGDVGEVIGDAVEQVGNAVEEIGQQVGKTVEAIAQDPAKGLALIAVAVIAPELAPLLWEGATIAEAAMVLNTGMQLAQGADPMSIAQNLAVSMATQGLASNLDVTTGSFMADKAIGSAASAALQDGNVNKAIGSSLGNSLIGMGTGAISGEIRNFDYKGMYDQAVQDNGLSEKDAIQLVQGRIFQDGVNSGIESDKAAEIAKNFDPSAEEYAAYKDAPASQDEILNAKIFKDAIDAGFTQEEAAAIAKGTIEGQNPTVSNPVAGASVTVEGAASDTPQTTSPITYASVSKEDLDKELGDGEIDQETYDALLPYASAVTKSEQEYVDPEEVQATEPSPIDATKPDTTIPYGALNETTDDQGQKIYTYDDGSTLTLGGNGEVVDVTEATDTGVGGNGSGGNNTFDNAMDQAEDGQYQQDEYVEEEDPTSKSGFSLKFGSGSGRGSKAGLARKGLVKSSTSTGTSGSTSATGGLDTLGGEQYGVGLTASTAKGNPQYSLMGEEPTEEPQGFATGGSAATQGVYDLSSTASSPFLGGGNSDIMALKPTIVKGKINYALPGYPFGQEWKAAKEGGHMVDDHNPTFFSEGGLGKMKNTYVKGDGDGTSDSIAAMLADGEFVIPADVVSNLGNGSNDAGAKVLNEFLRTIRAHKRKADPKGLPPDSKGALGYLAAAKKKVKK